MAFNTWDIVSSYNNSNVPYSVYQAANNPIRRTRTQKEFLDNMLSGTDKLSTLLNLMNERQDYTSSTQQPSSSSTSSDEDDNVKLESVYNLGTLSVEDDEETNDDDNKKKERVKRADKFSSNQDFINTMLQKYSAALSAAGLNPEFAKYLTAQDAVESAYGKSPSGTYNYGGIKDFNGKNSTTLRTREDDGKGNLYHTTSRFVNYNSIDDYVNQKVRWLSTSPRYKHIFRYEPSQFFTLILSAGYATDINYAKTLRKTYNSLFAS